ncbi:uncharacterized protein [Panulirus ornatus]|uniref:uncharacterized protein isoform X10 n=1 Tax=Panulirus ornatus TaxID=150431 RepID=UPI003A84C347
MEGRRHDRNVRKEKSFLQGGEARGHQDSAAVKKERSFVRHSHHHHQQQQQQQQQYHHNKNNNNNNNNGGRRFLQRERSFVRPQPDAAFPHIQAREQSRRRSAMPATSRSKPAMELYRPPISSAALRGPGIFDNANSDAVVNGKLAQNGGFPENRSGLNVNAREFVSVSTRPPLQHSKSSSSVPLQSVPISRPPSLAIGILNQPGIKRSKSLGSADLRASQLLEASTPTTTMPDLGPFSPDVQNSITKAMNDPNSVSARQLMEVVRHVFTRVVEASRHAEPAARLCIAIIEKEKNETFLESLLNTCQEYFQERDRLLRNNPPAPYPGFVPAHPRWIAYMTFLNEMYTQLKRRHVQLMTKRMRNSETPPGLLLLTLLAQCCQVCLKENSVNSLAETECLFFVLTGLGKDIEVELPHQMARVMSAARDAFLTTVRVPAVRKTLLQLIEMHAARWQLPAPAVMYYYPGSGSK